MRQAVKDGFVSFSRYLEGITSYLYLDVGDLTDASVLGKVTAAMGNLADPVELALAMPWLNADGSTADSDTVRAQWQIVKDRQDLRKLGGGHFSGLTTVHLSPEGIQSVVEGKLAQVEPVLIAQFPGFSDWCADGQMGLLSLTWARGPNGYASAYPKFTAALNQDPPDFATAAEESRMYNGTADRNAATKLCFNNAHWVQTLNLDPETLYYPKVLDENSGGEKGGGGAFNTVLSEILGPSAIAHKGSVTSAASSLVLWILGIGALGIGGTYAYKHARETEWGKRTIAKVSSLVPARLLPAAPVKSPPSRSPAGLAIKRGTPRSPVIRRSARA